MTIMPTESSELVHAVSAFMVAARFELMAFASAMVMFAILSWARAHKDKGKLVEESEIAWGTNSCWLNAPSAATAADKMSSSEGKQADMQLNTSSAAEAGTMCTDIIQPDEKAVVQPTKAKAASPKKVQPDIAKEIMMMRKSASEKNLKGAVSILESLRQRGVEMNTTIYNSMLDVCVKCWDLEALDAWMQEAKQVGAADVVSYSTLVKAHMLNDDLDKARSVVREMNEAGMQPTFIVFNELVNAAVSRGGEESVVWDVIREMREMRMAPNQVTCSILLKSLNAQTADAEVVKVMDLIARIKEPINDILMSSMVSACKCISKPYLVTSRLQQLQQTKKLVGNSSQTIASLIKAYGIANDIQSVWRCWMDMRSRHIKPTSPTLVCMIEALANNGCTNDGFDLVQQLQADPQCYDVVSVVMANSALKSFACQMRQQRPYFSF